ncbi:Neuronal pentraxin-2 [Exaiptasia diaphana]|nr:Neuronal pentraxin-2 [Exaiptasia diaphana]
MRIVKFTRESVTDYIVVKRKLPAMARLTVCLWMMTSKSSSMRTMISYAVPANYNEMILYNHHKTLYVHVVGSGWNSRVLVVDGQWHHICATWDNSAGQTVIYKDGVRRAQGSLKKGPVIKSGGSLIIGQDQDKVGGGFQKYQSFVGELTGINIWNRVLGLNEISAMSKNREIPASGNVLTWNDVISGTKYGQVQIIDSCKK